VHYLAIAIDVPNARRDLRKLLPPVFLP
jgi:hypothetical protein